MQPKKFSEYPPVSILDGEEILPLLKDGGNSATRLKNLPLSDAAIAALETKVFISDMAGYNAGNRDRQNHTGTQLASTISDFAAAADARILLKPLNEFTLPTGALNLNGWRITNLGEPTGSQDAVTKSYVDAVSAGLSIKAPVRVASTANVDISSPGAVIDGVTLEVTERVLLKNQTDASKNGLYSFNGADVAMTRTFDANSSAEMKAGTYTYVTDGTVNNDTAWVITTNNPIVLDTTNLTFSNFSAVVVPDASSSVKGKVMLAGDLAGIGSTAASPKLKNIARVFNVLDYGALDDGTTDNSVALQACMDAAGAARGTFYVPRTGGIFALRTRIVPRSYVTIDGGGELRNIEGAPGGIQDTIGSACIFKDDGVTDITDLEFRDILLSGKGNNTGTSNAIMLTGDLDPNVTQTNKITNVTMLNVKIRDCASLPIRLAGVRGKVICMMSEFTRNADPGWIFCEEVILIGCHSMDSHDNGFSLSRGNFKVTCIGNTIENPFFWGIWASGFNNQNGPQYAAICNNIIRNSRRSGIALINAPRNVTCTGNVIDMNYNRPTDSDIDGIQVRGASAEIFGDNVTVTGNTILRASRNGISYGWMNRLTITGNNIIDPGTQYKVSGATISPTDATTNIGILQNHTCTDVWIDGNSITDRRATPLMNYDMQPMAPNGTSQVRYGKNYSYGARNKWNSLVIRDNVKPGNALTISVDGPDANINLHINNQGTGETIIRGGGGLNIHGVGSGTNAGSQLVLSAGNTTLKTGKLTATRVNPASSTQLALSVLAAGVMTPSSGVSALFYIEGSSTTTNVGRAVFNTGLQLKRRALLDTSFTAGANDYIHGYSTLTVSRTATLPNAAGVAGRLFVFKDETGSASGSKSITLTPWTLGATSFTDADVIQASNIIRLASVIETGTPIIMNTAGTMPGGITAGTTYYVTRNTLLLNNLFANPGTIASDSSVGYGAWSNTSNASGSDNAYSSWQSDANIDPSNPRGDTLTFTGTITAADKTLTSDTAIFNLLSVGQYVRIPGAGASGADLITTVASFTSATELELTLAASTTVSSVVSAIGSTDPVQSQLLKVTNYGFAIPATASIEGVKVEVEGKSLSTTSENLKVYDTAAQLIVGGVAAGVDKSLITAFTGADTLKTYGGTDDTWQNALTPTIVNASNFGFQFQAQSIFGRADVDNIKITVYYTLPGDIKLATSLTNALSGTSITISSTGSGTVNITSPAQTVDGASSKVINTAGGAVQLYSDGLNWQTYGGFNQPAVALKSATTNVDVSAATAPINGQVLTATGGSAATWQTPSAAAAYLPNPTTMAIAENDFLGVSTTTIQHPWLSLAVSSGAASSSAGVIDHPGVFHSVSSTTANSGVRLQTNVTSMILAGGEATDIIFKAMTTALTTSFLGFQNSSTVAAPTDGCWINISGTTLSGICANNNTATATASTYTITQGSWYRLKIVVTSSSLVTFTLYDSTGAQVWTDTVATNIPVGTSRSTGHGLTTTNSGTTAVGLVDIDYMNITIGRTLTR